ncbi:hypothetical protein ACIHAA_08500 [Streptomyces sp. NPDC052040]|uniref:hypothetical protein n=1 Tax=unclassified Streptomyces TaxID=2593676 RepID=UPI0037D71D44
MRKIAALFLTSLALLAGSTVGAGAVTGAPAHSAQDLAGGRTPGSADLPLCC